MKKWMIGILVLLSISFVSATCPLSNCPLNQDARGQPFSFNLTDICYYNNGSTPFYALCYNSEPELDRWIFYDYGSCNPPSCTRSCFDCDSLGRNCDSLQWGYNAPTDCPNKDCNCTQNLGFPAEEQQGGAIPEISKNSITMLTAVLIAVIAVLIGVVIMKKK
jgi:hypothetical protein